MYVSMLLASRDGRDHESEVVSRSGMAVCQELGLHDPLALRLLVESFLIAWKEEALPRDELTSEKKGKQKGREGRKKKVHPVAERSARVT